MCFQHCTEPLTLLPPTCLQDMYVEGVVSYFPQLQRLTLSCPLLLEWLNTFFFNKPTSKSYRKLESRASLQWTDSFAHDLQIVLSSMSKGYPPQRNVLVFWGLFLLIFDLCLFTTDTSNQTGSWKDTPVTFTLHQAHFLPVRLVTANSHIQPYPQNSRGQLKLHQ